MNAKTSLLTVAILVAAVVNCLSQPFITTDPQSRSNVVGTDAMFTVLATGTEPLAYQWRLSTAYLAGKTNDTLTLTNVQTANAGEYTVVVTNGEGAVTSLVATLTVLLPPKITKQPTNQTASLFADATFRVTATGDSPLSYQWRFNDGDLAGMTNTSLTVTNVQRTNAGSYIVVVKNLSGSVTSQLAALTITPFNAIYCFGFSWTDTGGNGCDWPSPQYYQNRACNGPMWPQFLSTNLGLAYVAANNYAVCGGVSSWVLDQVNNRFRVPSKPQLSAYFMWASYDDFTELTVTNEAAFIQSINNQMATYSNTVHRLYLKGARQIVAETTMDLSKFPGKFDEAYIFGTNAAGRAKYSAYLGRLNAAFLDTINSYGKTKQDLRILSVDVFSKLNEVLANPAQHGFTKTDIDALHDGSLPNKSFTGPGADYVFWDQFHGTTKLHELMTAWHLEALTNSVLEKLEVSITGGSLNIQLNHLLIGRDYTLQGSPDLTNWQGLQTFTAAAGTNRWTRSSEDATGGMFYRLKWQQ